jgi:hypothetical protein
VGFGLTNDLLLRCYLVEGHIVGQSARQFPKPVDVLPQALGRDWAMISDSSFLVLTTLTHTILLRVSAELERDWRGGRRGNSGQVEGQVDLDA